MHTYTGVPASTGIVVGPVEQIDHGTTGLHRIVCDPFRERALYDVAVVLAKDELRRLSQRAKGPDADILLFQIALLEDESFTNEIGDYIAAGAGGAAAVERAEQIFAGRLKNVDDEYIRERSVDVCDVCRRVVDILDGRPRRRLHLKRPSILVADRFFPSDLFSLDRRMVLGLASDQDSTVSHAAIMARSMGIPAVVGLGDSLLEEFDGRDVFVDGGSGEVFVEPDSQATAELEARRDKETAHRHYLDAFRGREAITPDGHRILVCANIGAPKDLEAVQDADADGIGLFRSEFLYLGRDNYPPEEDQYRTYRQVLEAMDGRMVVIRTLDIGADKQADYFELPKEENPAMGLRAIRICLARPEVFRTQLRALYRASAYGKLGIMFPMITSVSEVLRVKEICAQVQEELKAEGIPFDVKVELGIMIETPAAAVISDLLAKEVNFFSIGTNDLTQYTLAVDRQNAQVESFCDRHHEALLRLIRTTVENAHRAGIWAGICGELAADTTLTDFFMEIGVDELSMTPGAILETKAKILDR